MGCFPQLQDRADEETGLVLQRLSRSARLNPERGHSCPQQVADRIWATTSSPLCRYCIAADRNVRAQVRYFACQEMSTEWQASCRGDLAFILDLERNCGRSTSKHCGSKRPG